MSKYTAEQVERRAGHFEKAGILDIAAMLREYAAILREREDYEGTACDICGEPNLHGSRHRQCGLALQAAVEKELRERESLKEPPHCSTCKEFQYDCLDCSDALEKHRESAKAGVTDDVAVRVAHALEQQGWATGGDFHEEFLPDVRAVLEAVAQMLASARVPDEKEDLDPVRLRREGRVATEWERGFNEGWNDCRDAMLAAAPKPEKE